MWHVVKDATWIRSVVVLKKDSNKLFFITTSGTDEDDQQQQQQKQTQQQQKQQQKQQQHSAFCLLIKDENDILSEWIAYHYHVFNMRRLIVAVDPSSVQTPLDVLQYWGHRIYTTKETKTTSIDTALNSNPSSNDTSTSQSSTSTSSLFDLKYTIWHDDDYTPYSFWHDKEYDDLPNSVSTGLTINETTNEIIKSDWHSSTQLQRLSQQEIRHDVHVINNHRYRQRNFVSECYRQLLLESNPIASTQHQRQKETTKNDDADKNDNNNNYYHYWTVHIDTDEYLVPNPWIGSYTNAVIATRVDDNDTDSRTDAITTDTTTTAADSIAEDDDTFVRNFVVPIVPSKPTKDSLWNFFQQYYKERYHPTAIKKIKAKKSSVCIMMPRPLFGSKEDTSDDDDDNIKSNENENEHENEHENETTTTIITITLTTNDTNTNHTNDGDGAGNGDGEDGMHTNTPKDIVRRWRHKKFESLRWKYHQDFRNRTRPKAMVDVSKLHLQREPIFLNRKIAISIHRPLAQALKSNSRVAGCPAEPRSVYNINQVDQPLAVYHYLGSKQRYLNRTDVRRTESIYNGRNKHSNYALGDDNNDSSNENANAASTNRTTTVFRWWIGGWLEDFVDTYGIETAISVLGGTYTTVGYDIDRTDG